MNTTVMESEIDGRTAADLAKRKDLLKRLESVKAAKGWSNGEVSRRSGIGSGTLSQWASDTYKGRYDTVNAKIETFLDNLGEVEEIAASVPVAPSFLPLAFSQEVVNVLTIAQVMPAMVMVTAEAGIGKTAAAESYVATHANAWLVTISPNTSSRHNMLAEIARVIDCAERHPGRLVSSIGQRLQRTGAGTLLIVDEAQNLSDDAINQLRHFVDIYKCGIALLGNTETYTRFAGWSQGEKYGQLRRRIFKRIRRDRPAPADVKAFIAAWGVEDPKQVEFLVGVGMKPGALGQVDMTIKLARMVAMGAGREMTLADLKAAWANRDVESA